jgi:hypothetical protein
MDDPVVPDAAARAAAREAGLPWFRGGIVEHGGAGHPIMEAIHLPSGEMHSRLMLDSPMRDCLAVLTMQGEDLPSRPTDRLTCTKDVWGLLAGRATYTSHQHEVACAKHWAPHSRR